MDKLAKAKHDLFFKRKKLIEKALSRDKRKAEKALSRDKAKRKAITERCILLLAERKGAKRNEKQP